MRINFRILIGICFVTLLVSSCGVNKNLMFKTPKGVVEQKDSIPLRPATEYTISVDDKFTFELFTKDGEDIINGMAGILKDREEQRTFEYVIRQDGTADLPLIGGVRLVGLTVHQCEDTLAKLYEESKGYIQPYVQLKLTNQRVIVFPGSGSDAKVVPLQNNNTTLMEVIALAGGIAERGRADKVKLMRNVGGKRIVYVLNLSTIEGLKYADMIVQANDYIYIEPTEQLTKELVERAAPIVSLISSTLIVLTFITNLK